MRKKGPWARTLCSSSWAPLPAQPPKSGPDLRGDIKDLAGRLKRKAQEAGMTLCPECGEEGQHEHDEASGS